VDIYMSTCLYYGGDLKINSITGTSNSTLSIGGTIAVSTIIPNSTLSTANVTVKPSGSGIFIIDESTVGGASGSVTTIIAANTYGSYRLNGTTGAAYLGLQDSTTAPEISIGGLVSGSDSVISNRVGFHYTGNLTEIAGPVRITNLATNLTPKIYYEQGFTSSTVYSGAYTNASVPTTIQHVSINFSGSTAVTTLVGQLNVGTSGTHAPLNVYGTCSNLTGTWVTFADETSKKDIKSFSPDIAMKVISDLKVKKYTESGSNSIGLIAQDVKKTQDAFLSDIRSMVSKADNGLYLFDNSAIPYLLISVVQELIKKNKELELKINAMMK
jgi:hypothetical protein